MYFSNKSFTSLRLSAVAIIHKYELYVGIDLRFNTIKGIDNIILNIVKGYAYCNQELQTIYLHFYT